MKIIMKDEDKIYEDEARWTCFKGETPDETIGVYRRCPECGRFITEGKLFINFAGYIRLEGWKCKQHGEIEPFYYRW